MLEVDARKRITASELARDPFILCNDIRLTVFETAGTTFRNAQADHFKKNGRSGIQFNSNGFSKESLREAHIITIEHLVSCPWTNLYRKQWATNRRRLKLRLRKKSIASALMCSKSTLKQSTRLSF